MITLVVAPTNHEGMTYIQRLPRLFFGSHPRVVNDPYKLRGLHNLPLHNVAIVRPAAIPYWDMMRDELLVATGLSALPPAVVRYGVYSERMTDNIGSSIRDVRQTLGSWAVGPASSTTAFATALDGMGRVARSVQLEEDYCVQPADMIEFVRVSNKTGLPDGALTNGWTAEVDDDALAKKLEAGLLKLQRSLGEKTQ